MSGAGWVLLGAAVLLGAVELASTNLVFGSLAVGALAAAGADWVGAPTVVVAAVGLGVAAVCLLALRPAVLRRWSSGRVLRTGADGLRGQTGRVLTGGSRAVVRVSGQDWSAVADGPGDLVEGDEVWVVDVQGATLVVAVSR